MVLGTLNDDPVAFISGNKLCLTFHPELDQIDIFHRILLIHLGCLLQKNRSKTFA
ncbi:MAG: hypothetical protein CM15mP87_02010 [Candidatus Neomarinimicrobiota bacterium]|nr:MAG: hypothetical protein CM15mP87_02010 [Candidatus Neomarinimicrobiota bacterium]